MSEELNLDKELEKEELVRIKEQLTMMKVKFHHNANLETLKKVLAEALEPKEEVKESATVVRKTAKEIREEAMKLVRCNVICHDPMRKSRKGEFITVGNSIIGTFRVFVPYNGTQDVVWHIPRIAVDILKRKTCIKNVRQVDKGHQHSTLDDVQIGKAFDIVELPPLTPEELKELAETQKALGYSISAPNQYAGN